MFHLIYNTSDCIGYVQSPFLYLALTAGCLLDNLEFKSKSSSLEKRVILNHQYLNFDD